MGLRPQHHRGRHPKSTAGARLHAFPERAVDAALAREYGAGFYTLPEDQQEELVAEWRMRRDLCDFHGGPRSECPDDDRDWFPQRDICWPAAQLEAAKRLYALIHEDAPYHDGSFKRWAKKPSRDYPFLFSDGVTIRLARTDEQPDDDFLGSGSVGKAGDADEPGPIA